MVSQMTNFTSVTSDQPLFTLFLITLAVVLFQSLFAIFANVLFISVLKRAKLIHNNVRWLLANTSMAAILLSVGSSFWSTKHLLYSNQLWTYKTEAPLCALQESIGIAGLIACLYSVVCIGCERLWATKNQFYNDNRGRIGQALSGMFWIAAVSVSVASVIGAWHMKPVYYCVAQFVVLPSLIYIVICSVLVGDFIILIVYIWLFCYSQNTLSVLAVNQAYSTLRARYQIRRNLELTRMLLPSVLLHALVNFSALPVVFYTSTKRSEKNNLEALVVINARLAVILLHSTFHPVICFRDPGLYKILRRILWKSFCSCKKEQVQSPKIPVTDNHHMTFEEHERILLKTWSGGMERTKVKNKGMYRNAV